MLVRILGHPCRRSPVVETPRRFDIYTLILNTHSVLRWIVLAAAAWALIRAYSGWLGSKAWSPVDRRAGLTFSVALDLQVLLGVVLAVVSPLIRNALPGLGAAMAEPHLRFFLVEHIPVMLIALVLVHVGSRQARAASDDRMKHRRAALMYTLALVAVVVAMPWWRPLLPGLA